MIELISPVGLYFCSWSSKWSSSPENLDLCKIPWDVNIVFLAFGSPNCTYQKGQNSFSGTGLQFSSDFSTVKGAIEILKKSGIIVMLSIGGATYPFSDFNPTAVVDLANDLNVSGIDIDYESIDKQGLLTATQAIKSCLALNSQVLLLSLAAFSVGAYGSGDFVNAQPTGSAYTGLCIPTFSALPEAFDFINIMSYDAGNSYDPKEAFRAYRSYFKGLILMGFEVAPEAWGGHEISITEVTNICEYVKPLNGGSFVWSYQKQAGSGPTSLEIIEACNDVFFPTPNPTPRPPNPTPNPSPSPSPKPKPNPNPQPVPGIKAWTYPKFYNVKDLVIYAGKKYECRQSHTSQSDWTPYVTPALWLLIN